MAIPLVDLRMQYDSLQHQVLAEIAKVLDGMHLFLGENVQGLEREYAEYCGAKHGIGVSDGTAALVVILKALGIGPGDEVITVGHTFMATAEAVALTGARPVFVDIDRSTYLMDVAQIEMRITARTRAIIPVHLYGQPVDMKPLMALAEKYGLKVIEDACQAHGAEYRGKRAGSLGTAAAFSFYFSKNLGAYGEAGMITTNDDELARRIRMIRDHGSERRYQHELIGFNARLDEIQAAILRVKLPHLQEWNRQRRLHAATYNEALAGVPVVTPFEALGNRHVYHLYVIRAPRRAELQAWLAERHIASGIHYPIPCHLQPALAKLGYRTGDLPVTERAAAEILSLPMYPELTPGQIESVADAIRSFYKTHRLDSETAAELEAEFAKQLDIIAGEVRVEVS